jgi:aspartyl-tRNA(Asn)/glutamyl-tRNA(Gln) amidotransferase subunit A
VTQRVSYAETRAQLAASPSTVEDTTTSFLRQIGEFSRLNAYLSVFTERAILHAREVDRKRRAGKAGPLAGMVVAVKDNLCVRGEKATCASKMLENFVAPYDATVVRRLEEADAVIIGKTNLDEFAMGSSTENSAFGRVLHPGDESKVPGGSSGGSCVAVAAGLAHTALGSDTGGSIRQPAAFCGIVGLKPTFGRVSRYGLIALSSSFDQVGPFGNNVEDVATVLQVIAGHDTMDATSADLPVPTYANSLGQDLRGLRVGVPDEASGEGVQEEVRAALEKASQACRESGAEVRQVTLPHSRFNIAAYYVLMTAEASSNLARYDGARYGHRASDVHDLAEMYTHSRSEGFGPETKRRIMLGTYVLSAGYYDAYYRKAQKVRRLIRQDFLDVFASVDSLLLPTAPTTAFDAGEKIEDPLQMYLSDVFTVAANLAGVPAISVPCGHDRQGLPIGMQFVGRHFDEPTVLRAADALARAVAAS